MLDATPERIWSTFATLSADFKMQDPEGFIYYMRGGRVGMIFCQEKKPADGHRNRPHIGKVLGGVYETERDESNHYFRKYDGWAVSKFLLMNASAFGFTSVRFVFPVLFSGQRAAQITVADMLQHGRDICEGHFEKQLLVIPQHLQEVAWPPST